MSASNVKSSDKVDSEEVYLETSISFRDICLQIHFFLLYPGVHFSHALLFEMVS